MSILLGKITCVPRHRVKLVLGWKWDWFRWRVVLCVLGSESWMMDTATGGGVSLVGNLTAMMDSMEHSFREFCKLKDWLPPRELVGFWWILFSGPAATRRSWKERVCILYVHYLVHYEGDVRRWRNGCWFATITVEDCEYIWSWRLAEKVHQIGCRLLVTSVESISSRFRWLTTDGVRRSW